MSESQVSMQLRWALRPMQHLLDDREITDVHVNKAGPDGETTVFIKRNGRRERRAIKLTAKELDAIAKHAAVLGRSLLTEEMPSSPGKFPDAQRAHLVMSPALPEGEVAISVRRTSRRSATPQDLEDYGVFDLTVAAEEAPERQGVAELLEMKQSKQFRLFLETAFGYGFSGVFAGVVNTGKTFNLRAFFHAIDRDKRIITVEDAEELIDMPQSDVVHFLYPKGAGGVSRHTAENCVEWGLRMDMDEIVNGEVRDAAAWALMRAGASGHPFKTSCHAPSAEGAFDAMLLMAKQHKDAQTLETDDLKQTLRQLIDFVAFCEVIDGKRRISQIWFDPEAKKGLSRQAVRALGGV